MKRIIARVGMVLIVALLIIGPGIAFYIHGDWVVVGIFYGFLAIVILLVFAIDWCHRNFYS